MSRGQSTTSVAKRKPLSLKLSRGAAAKNVDLKDIKTCAPRTATVEDKENFNTVNSQKVNETIKRINISSPTKRAVFRAKVEAVVAAHQASKDDIIEINDVKNYDELPIIEKKRDCLKAGSVIMSSNLEKLPIIESNGSLKAYTVLSIMLLLVFVTWSAARIAMLEPFRDIILTHYQTSVAISSPQYVSVAAYLQEHKVLEQEFICTETQEPTKINLAEPDIEEHVESIEEANIEEPEPVIQLEGVDSTEQEAPAVTEAVVALLPPARSSIGSQIQIAGNRLRSIMKPIVEVFQRLQKATKNWFHQAVRLFSSRGTTAGSP